MKMKHLVQRRPPALAAPEAPEEMNPGSTEVEPAPCAMVRERNEPGMVTGNSVMLQGGFEHGGTASHGMGMNFVSSA